MTTELQIPVDRERIAQFCRRWNVVELALFGSVLRGEFRPDSDVDVLITLAPGAKRCMFDWMQMHAELTKLLGRQVDLVDKRVLERSDNYIRRRSILESAQVIYGA